MPFVSTLQQENFDFLQFSKAAMKEALSFSRNHSPLIHSELQVFATKVEHLLTNRPYVSQYIRSSQQ